MHPFSFSRADDPAQAIALHALDPQLSFIAGGTDLLGLMKDRAIRPERLLDINGLSDMARIQALPDGGLRIGALARMSDVAAHMDLRSRFRASPRRSCSPPQANSAIWRRWAATSCSARDALISAIWMTPLATNARRAQAVRRGTDSIAITPSSAGPTPA